MPVPCRTTRAATRPAGHAGSAPRAVGWPTRTRSPAAPPAAPTCPTTELRRNLLSALRDQEVAQRLPERHTQPVGGHVHLGAQVEGKTVDPQCGLGPHVLLEDLVLQRD